MNISLGITSKVLIALALIALPVGTYYTGKLVEKSACNTKVLVKELKATIKRRDTDAEIDKIVDGMDDATVHNAYKHWVS